MHSIFSMDTQYTFQRNEEIFLQYDVSCFLLKSRIIAFAKLLCAKLFLGESFKDSGLSTFSVLLFNIIFIVMRTVTVFWFCRFHFNFGFRLWILLTFFSLDHKLWIICPNYRVNNRVLLGKIHFFLELIMLLYFGIVKLEQFDCKIFFLVFFIFCATRSWESDMSKTCWQKHPSTSISSNSFSVISSWNEYKSDELGLPFSLLDRHWRLLKSEVWKMMLPMMQW